jgi:hypothetical protein
MPRIALLFVSVVAVSLKKTATQQPTAPHPTTVPHDTVRGAVRAIDVRARTVDVSTGVGYALRVVRLQVPATLPITDHAGDQSEPIKLAELKLGDVIRASFGGQTAPFVAYTIERVGRMETGVPSTP